MRAKGTLAAFCVLIGAAAITPTADAAERGRTAQKQNRTAQVTTVSRTAQQPRALAAQRGPSATARAAAAKPARTQVAARRSNTQRQNQASVPNGARRASASRLEARQQASRPAAIERQPSFAATPVAFGLVRPAFASGVGTPILPVASGLTLSCVPFARMATGMEVSGNGGMWWHNAAGRYARGQQPERGAVLVFAGQGGMSRGHVAVVSRVLSARSIHIDHANWGGPGIRPGSIMRGVEVQDVSDRNDWTAVRVQVGYDSTAFGRVNSAYGFIYNRGGSRVMTADGAPQNGRRFEEVAEGRASPHAAQHGRLTSQLFSE